MVQLYNCHPFGSQQIVPARLEPELCCCGGDSIFVVCAGGCKVEVFRACEEGWSLFCTFSTLGRVLQMSYCDRGDYLVTIEEKNKVATLRSYMNWRCKSTGNSRVSVRMLGLKLEAPYSGASKDQMEIVELPLSEPPLCISCCPVQGDLLVGCRNKLVLFTLKHLMAGHNLEVLDFERSLILHTSVTPLQVAYCGGYVSFVSEFEVAIFQILQGPEEISNTEVHTVSNTRGQQAEGSSLGAPPSPSDFDEFVICQRPVELIGKESKSRVLVTLESTGLPEEGGKYHVNYILYRSFAPDLSQTCSVEDTRLHSLQMLPMYRTGYSLTEDGKTSFWEKELLSLFCFFSMPHIGYLYTIGKQPALISTYQYPERSQQAVLSPQFLHVITSLQCFTVRCSAAAARDEDPYIDTTMKTCPPVTLDVCALRMQLFIGLKTICRFKNHVILLTKANMEDYSERVKLPKIPSSRKSIFAKREPPVEAEPGWNLYVVNLISASQLYKEMVEYSTKSRTVRTQSSIHLLSEAHLLVRAALMDHNLKDAEEKDKLLTVFRESCVLLGDCFSRFDTKDSHLALPYYKMSGLSLSKILSRAVLEEESANYGKGFIFYLKHSLFEELDEVLNEEMATKVLHILNGTEKSHLPHALCSPCMQNVCRKTAMKYLQNLNISTPSTLVTLTKAAMALKMQNFKAFEAEMERHSEMMLVCGFLDEPRLLIQRKKEQIHPTQLSITLKEFRPGVLVASMVALHEHSKLNLPEAQLFFRELCGKYEEDYVPQLLVDFWEALVVACPQDSVLRDLLCKLTSHYVDTVSKGKLPEAKPLKTTEDLINSCDHYGLIYPWISVMSPESLADVYNMELAKLQALLCGPSVDIISVIPSLESIPEDNNAALSIHVLCKTRLGNYEDSIDSLLDQCPEAVITYASHEFKDGRQALWWNKLLPELCKRIRLDGCQDQVLISCLKETLSVVAMELDLRDFLSVCPDDGNVAFFLPYVMHQSTEKLGT
ncbi:BLOC-2 complex member HPS3 isoform X2 [Pleurodeles waltl]|uniref:BLOC-2 complex member HPS3 isoform X2 n=1 Tax=Pleurodeles waltl TaxID=8319 RepID=UPI0037095578